MDLRSLLEWIRLPGGAVDVVVANKVWFGTALTALLIGARVFEGWAFLARYNYDGGLFGYIRAIPRFLLTLRVDLLWGVGWITSPIRDLLALRSADTARLLTEIEILDPPDPRPLRDYPVRERGLGAWALDIARRRNARFGAVAGWWWRKRQWKRDRNALLRKLVRVSKSGGGETADKSHGDKNKMLPIIPVDNPARIDRSRDEISRYFEIAKRFGATRFVSSVHLTDGYFAPLFLINGLMTRFADDWKPIIDNYRKQLAGPSAVSPEFVELQSFEFNCWLLWGPSVPLCTCEHWQSDYGKADSQDDPLLYQYGYGDENNSIDVRVLNGRSRGFVEDKLPKGLLRRQRGETAVASAGVYAVPQSLIGQIGHGHGLDEEEIGPAQSVIRHHRHGRIFLTLQRFAPVSSVPVSSAPGSRTLPKASSSYYYSAYIWLMFVVCDDAGRPMHGTTRWRNLLPFFEHGNIADASTYQTLKLGLVIKACRALKDMFERQKDAGKFRIRYACAFDDSNCGEPVLLPAGDLGLFHLLKRTASHPDLLGGAIADGRLILEQVACDDAARARPLDETPRLNDYAACYLPEVVAEFYEVIQKAADEAAAAKTAAKKVARKAKA